jgi:hypothetical protein
MELIPFNEKWADSGSKLDLFAVYQRGDVIATLAVRRHSDWVRKGWHWVTLATAHDAREVVSDLRAAGVDLSKIQCSYEANARAGFKAAEYLKEQPDRDAEEAKGLKKRLAQIEKGAKASA